MIQLIQRLRSMRLIIFSIILTSSAAFGQSAEYEKVLNRYYNDFPTMTCSEASKLTSAKNVHFLDTREKNEYNVSHIKGAKCVGYDDFKMSSVDDIPKDATIIVYCSIGARSQKIGEKLEKAGYKNVQNLYGGFFQWSNSGYPKYNAEEKVTEKIHGYSKHWGKWITKGDVVY